MAKKKDKKKIFRKKKIPKIKTIKKVKILRAKNKEFSPDIIFDSKIGKTDALFVSLPDTEKETAKQATPQLDPEIDRAIKEFDVLENTQKTQESKPLSQPLITEKPAEVKKSFWEKLLFFKKF